MKSQQSDLLPAVPKFVRFGRAICGDLKRPSAANGGSPTGSAAMPPGTIAGSLTRRYHGLLIAPVDPPLGRRLVWAKADAELVDGERDGPCSPTVGAAARSARPVTSISNRFHLDGAIPVWLFRRSGLMRIEARIWLEPGANTTYVAWRLLPGCERLRAASLCMSA